MNLFLFFGKSKGVRKYDNIQKYNWGNFFFNLWRIQAMDSIFASFVIQFQNSNLKKNSIHILIFYFNFAVEVEMWKYVAEKIIFL